MSATHPHDPLPTPRRHGVRPGLTFVEVIAAAALLAGLASVILGAVSFMESSFARQRHRLQAMEVAHRVVAQHIDNPELLPDSGVPIQQGRSFYRYTLAEEVLVQEDAGDQQIGRRTARRKQDLSVEDSFRHMLNKLTIRVYLDDPSNPALDARQPIVALTRLFDPIQGRPQDVALKELLELVQRAEREEAEARRNAARGRGK